MEARRIIRVLADRALGTYPETRRRKASDYAAILVGVAMISVMQDRPVVADEAALAAFAPAPTAIAQEVVPQAEFTVPTFESNASLSEERPTEEVSEPTSIPSDLQITQPDPAPTQSPAPSPSPTAIPTQTAVATGVPTEPASGQPRATTSSRSSRPATTPAAKFIAAHAEEAKASMDATSVPASVTLAQAILESNSGQSGLSLKANNYFGIKARGKEGPAGVVYMDTWEHLGGKDVTVREPFRAYHNAAESFTDHGNYFRENARYAEAMKNTDDARTFARLIHKAGYATDPNYSTKLIRIMDTYDLYQYDR